MGTRRRAGKSINFVKVSQTSPSRPYGRNGGVNVKTL